jgi:uncharacterized protein (UPF0261 family)
MRIVSALEGRGHEAVAFHPNGAGGRAMEEMIRHGCFDGVIDLTTHELIDELAGGEHAAGPERLEAASAMKLPQIVVPGSTDYIVMGPLADLPPAFRKRKTMLHNPEMTFVQPSDREMAALGRLMGHKLNRSQGGTVVMVPLKGFSYPNYPGRVFHNPSGVSALVRGLRATLNSSIPIRRLDMHVNDESFADAVVEEFDQLLRSALSVPR